SLGRRKIRTLFTVLSILVAFVLFGYLAAIRQAFRAGVDVSGVDRMVVIHKVSLIQPLPVSYGDRIAAVPGVSVVSHANWFGGIYQDPKNFFPQMAIDGPSYFKLYPELLLPEAQRKAWLADQTGAIVGKTTADRFGWKVGDRIPIQATIYRRKDGSRMWEFVIDGIYTGSKKGLDTSGFFFHYDYLREASSNFKDRVGWYIIQITDPKQAADVAKRIDTLFANSAAETKTSTEQAFAQGFANQIGDIGAITTAIVTAVFFTILLVAGNTMAQSVRERTSELAVLKTLGFTNTQVLWLVLVESLLLACLAGGLGLALAWTAVTLGGDPTHQFLPVFFLPERDLAVGAALVVLLGFVTGVAPAIQAMRLRIVDALRRV
ncbi:MAG TPA: FtsX-like permease family protein, partial [Thermoanaerobaculia bacterium]|nr:FtsX-like permease family protein [Thermoanaerobaculia bacterium]